jgi:serine/threonine protein kinase
LDSPSVNILALPAGYEFGGYRIERVLGAGGFGITYLATETLIGRKLAIKEFLPTGIATRSQDGLTVRAITGDNQEMYRWGIDRFRQEAKTLVSFQHPNVVAIERFFEANGTAYLVMQYIEGKSLGNVLREFDTVEAGEILEIVLPLLDGLAHVHEEGFLHRDIKPDNIFISEQGRPILIDFGAARQALSQQSKSLTAIVSEGYAPYEQYEAHGNQGPWTDIYAVGAVMYRCMTGERPVAAPSRVTAKFRGRPDPLPAVAAAAKGKYPPALMAMVERALAVNEDDRPQSVAEMLAMLKASEEPPRPSEAATGLVPDRTLLAATPGALPKPRPEEAFAPSAVSPPDTASPAEISAFSAPGPRRRISPIAIAAGIGALLVAGAATAWVGGVFTPAGSEISAVAARDAERRADEERRRRADEEQRRKDEEEAKRKADEEARRKADDEDAKRKSEEEAKRRADEEAKRKAEEERKKSDEERRADEDRKRKEDEARRAEAEQKRRAERIKTLVDRAAAQLALARNHMAQGRLLEARRAIDASRESAAEALKLEPASAEARKAAADADALAGELRTRIAARVKELAAAIERDIAAGRAAEAERKLGELAQLDPNAAELASLRTELGALKARQQEEAAQRRRREEEAQRRRREEEARRRAETPRPAAPTPAAPPPARTQPAPAPATPPARTPDRPIPVPP